jgi:RNA polymerase sigma factor (sigma-70 family)
MQDDADLLIQFSQDRSDEAFAKLVSRHVSFVYATALRQLAGDSHLAEDVAQGVFVDLARKAREVAKCPVLAGWLHISTHHAAAKAVRSEQRRRAREAIAQSVDLSDASANDAEWARIRPSLDEALRGLSRKDSDAILLRFFQAQSFAAIGAKLGLNENAARMRVERALERLRAQLCRRGITSTAVAIAAVLANEALIAAPAGLSSAVTNAALAATLGAGATPMTLLQFMSTTKLGVGIVALVTAIAVGWSGYEVQAAARDHAASGSAQAQLDSDRQALRELRERSRVAERNHGSLARKIAELRANQGRRTAVDIAKAGIVGTAPSAGKAIKATPAADPKLRGDLEVWFRGLAAIQFGPFFASAGLTADQQARLLDLLVLQKTLMLGSVVTSLRPDSVSSEEIDQQIQEFLAGANASQQYQDYVRTVDLRPVTFVLAASLASSDTPLTASEGEQLTQILAANSPAGQPMSPQTVNWDGVLGQARQVLTPPQLAALKSEAALVAADGVPGTSFHPPGTFTGGGEDPPAFVFNPSDPEK